MAEPVDVEITDLNPSVFREGELLLPLGREIEVSGTFEVVALSGGSQLDRCERGGRAGLELDVGARAPLGGEVRGDGPGCLPVGSSEDVLISFVSREEINRAAGLPPTGRIELMAWGEASVLGEDVVDVRYLPPAEFSELEEQARAARQRERAVERERRQRRQREQRGLIQRLLSGD